MARRSRDQLRTDISYLVGQLKEKVEGIPDISPMHLIDTDMKVLYEYERALQGALKAMKGFM